MATHLEIHVREIPKGTLTREHFSEQQVETPAPGPGEVLVRTLWLSIDAANRAWMQGATYREAVTAGNFMHGYALGEVAAVGDGAAGHQVGDYVMGELGWREFAVMRADRLIPVGEARPLSHHLSVLGIAGQTAYMGLYSQGQPKGDGQVMVVSAAAGSVGYIAGQIGKIRGCRVVGIAGGAEKCDWLTGEMGFDAAVDYKAGNLYKDLAAACPEGIDLYFDNVGGPTLETVLFQMRNFGHITCCGAVSQYDTDSPVGVRGIPGLLVVKRLTMRGFVYMDHAAELHDRSIADLGSWIASGQLQVVEDVVEGLSSAPDGLIGLLAGNNRGKRLVRVGSE